jgi:hypothetical protein
MKFVTTLTEIGQLVPKILTVLIKSGDRRMRSGLQIKAEKNKQTSTAMFHLQNAKQNHDINVDNTSVENAENFKYVGTTETDQSYI